MAAQMTVERLAMAAQRGDKDAFSELVERHYSMVHGLALSTTSDWTTAGDIAQDVFLAAWMNLPGLKHPAAFSVWLRRAARNTSLTWVRNQRYRDQLAAALAARLEHESVVAENPAEIAARKECLADIRHALQRLSPKLREALVLYYLEGNSLSESAEALGIKVDTMKKRLHLGCEKLRAMQQRQEEPILQQLPSYTARPHTERIMAGLAFGPAIPGLGKATPLSSVNLVLHHLYHGGSMAALKEAGLSVPLIKCAGMGASMLCCLLIGFGVAFPQAAPWSNAPARDADGETQNDIKCQKRMGMFMLEIWNDPVQGNSIQVLLPFPAYPAYQAGLRPGDRIVKINGLPVRPGYRNDPSFRWENVDVPVRLTIMRAQEGGGETPVEVDVHRNKASK